jgi:hypothetical protein
MAKNNWFSVEVKPRDRKKKGTSERVLLRFSVAFGCAAAIAAGMPSAQAQSLEFEGVAAIAAASINPPNPIDGCNRAKEDAKTKAASAGYKGKVDWVRLSNDSDCHLDTKGGAPGTYFIFTAKGRFNK